MSRSAAAGGSRSCRPLCLYFSRVVMTAAMMDPAAMMIPEMISMSSSFPVIW